MAEKRGISLKQKKTAQKSTGRKLSKEPDYDVIVIGTGMGGSAAGAISALHGLKTLILEKNPRPGGACSYYEKQGFQVDAGTHTFIRGNKGPFGHLTRRLGMGTPIEFLHTKYISTFKGANIDITVPTSKFAMAYQFILPRMMWQVKINPKYYPSIFRLGMEIVTMKQEEIDKLNHISVYDFMSRYTKNEEVKMMIAGMLGLFFIISPWEASAGESIYNLQKLIKENNLGYPRGGCVKIPRTFLDGAEKHGATLKLNTRVKKINISNNKVTGVTLDNGQVFTAHAVISTSNLSDTVEKFAGPNYFPKSYVEMVRGIKPSWTAVQAKVGLKKKLVKAGTLVGAIPLKMPGGFNLETAKKFMTDIENGILGDMMGIYAPIPSNFDPSLAPEGCQLFTIVGSAPTLDVGFKQKEQVWIDKMMDAIYQMVPKFKENIIFCDTWSVSTLADWIGKSNGSAITTAQSFDQVGVKRPPHETPVKGLYMAGDCAGPARGVGTELACQSGMDCGDLVASHIFNHILD